MPHLKVLSFFMYTLNIDMSGAGMPKDPFGSATITNIARWGSTGGRVQFARAQQREHV